MTLSISGLRHAAAAIPAAVSTAAKSVAERFFPGSGRYSASAGASGPAHAPGSQWTPGFRASVQEWAREYRAGNSNLAGSARVGTQRPIPALSRVEPGPSGRGGHGIPFGVAPSMTDRVLRRDLTPNQLDRYRARLDGLLDGMDWHSTSERAAFKAYYRWDHTGDRMLEQVQGLIHDVAAQESVARQQVQELHSARVSLHWSLMYANADLAREPYASCFYDQFACVFENYHQCYANLSSAVQKQQTLSQILASLTHIRTALSFESNLIAAPQIKSV